MAATLDPSNQSAYTAVAEAYEQFDKEDEAVAEYLKREKLAGRSDEGRRILEEVHRRSGLKGLKHHLAVERLGNLQRIAKTRRISPRAFAETYVAMGDFTQAMRWLEEAFRQRCPTLALLKTAPKWAPISGDSRFRDLLRRMSLP